MLKKGSLSKEGQDQVEALYLAGKSHAAIGKLFDRCERSISLLLNRRGVKSRKPGGTSGLRPWRERIKPEMVEECVRLYTGGKTAEQIGELYDASVPTVLKTLSGAGVKIRHGELVNGKPTGFIEDGVRVPYKKSKKKQQDALEKTRKLRAENPFYGAVNASRLRARKRGVPHSIKATDLKVPEFCPVLGIKIARAQGRGGGPRDNSPTIDRIIPGAGYVPSNVRVISDKANRIKSNCTVEELALVLADLKVITGLTDPLLEGDDALWL